MAPKKMNLLITGPPGIGKTTLIRKAAAAVKDQNPFGFYTSEIREGGIRKGFELVALDGRKALLSHVTIKSPYRVGRYGVDVRGFELFLDAIDTPARSQGIVLIDEIGKMECFSEKFQEWTTALLESRSPLVATIALRGTGFIAWVKSRKDVALLEMTRQNRENLASEILRDLEVHDLRRKEHPKK